MEASARPWCRQLVRVDSKPPSERAERNRCHMTSGCGAGLNVSTPASHKVQTLTAKERQHHDGQTQRKVGRDRSYKQMLPRP
ncbi:hypothetical protein VTN00DRAFT_7341 [Thermoascus crustaceus]|uniref:uncharacterized protein n=1 Tax=Thermoascus crustaceus TaxID=5088 RepID=UPI003744AD33